MINTLEMINKARNYKHSEYANNITKGIFTADDKGRIVDQDGQSISLNYFLEHNAEWKLVKWPVDFMTAIRAAKDGKRIIFEVRGQKFAYVEKHGDNYISKIVILPLNPRVIDDIENGIGPTAEHYFHEAIQYGVWYIDS